MTDVVTVRGNTTNDLGGDSGGPWWIGTGALGIHHGHFSNNPSIQVFSKIEHAENRLDVDVVLCVPSC